MIRYKNTLDTCFLTCYFLFAGVFEESNRPRPLAFDQNTHKVLNTELKQLYTAITRARVHVWIFDENEDNRAPMFEYFKARKLVQSVKEGDTGCRCHITAIYLNCFALFCVRYWRQVIVVLDGDNELFSLRCVIC